MIAALRRRLRAGGSDAGMSLVETLVAMSIFVTLLAVVMAATVDLSRSAVHAQNTADTSGDVRKAFETLDKQVRNADAVNFPGAAGGDYWVEFRTTPVTGSTSATAVATCDQWRYVPATGALQERSWAQTAAPTDAWTTVLITDAGTSQPQPFTMSPITAVQTLQELTVDLTVSRPSAGTSTLSSTFVASNSTAASPGNTAVDPTAAVRVSASPVCAPAGYRS